MDHTSSGLLFWHNYLHYICTIIYGIVLLITFGDQLCRILFGSCCSAVHPTVPQFLGIHSRMAESPLDSQTSQTPVIFNKKANWSFETEAIFIYILQLKKLEYNMRPANFKNARWQKIAREFNEAVGSDWNHVQLKGKLERWKHDWSIWKRIKEHAGVGWDAQRKVFTFGDWDALDKVIPGAKKMADRTFPHFDSLTELFSFGIAFSGYGPSSQFQGGNDEPKISGGDKATLPLRDGEVDSPVKDRSGEKRPMSDSRQTQSSKHTSRGGKKGKGEMSSIDLTLKKINAILDARMASIHLAKNVMEALKQLNLPKELFRKAIGWLSHSTLRCNMFLTLGEADRLDWIQNLP